MDERSRIAWLYRRVAFGLEPGQLDALAPGGAAAAAKALLTSSGTPPADPWQDPDFANTQRDAQTTQKAIDAWLTLMATTTRPFDEWATWFWHGLLVSSVQDVKVALPMIKQMRLFRANGLGSFPALLRAITVDGAMLDYLDGNTSTAVAPNENFSREILELFALGRGNYSETDIQAGARALTGWVALPRNNFDATFVRSRHDDAGQYYLGRSGVHDVDTVIAAITAHQACAPWITGKLVRAILGPNAQPAFVQQLSTEFLSTGFDTRALITTIITRALADESVIADPIVVAPVPWLVMAQRACGATLDPRVRIGGLRAAGQVPWLPPNVAGWPGGAAWLGSSTVAARFNLAVAVADATPATNPAFAAAKDGDAVALATALGLPRSFGAPTAGALAAVKDARSRLVLALTSPEFVLA
ncbi:MAG: DUF1800 family protein [Acidimicrobiia bacterium]